MLTGGDRRSIGRADEVVELIKQQPNRLDQLLACLSDDDSRVLMRAADAAEKISREDAGSLQPHKKLLLRLLSEAKQQELRWHLALIIPRLRLTPSERRNTADRLQEYLDDRSSIVKTFALQGLTDLVRQDPNLGPEVLKLLRSVTKTGTPAMKARARKLLRQSF